MAGRFRTEGLTLGLLLVGLGVLWTLSNLGRIDLLSTLHTWWPSALVIWGLLELGAALAKGKGWS